MKAQKVKDRPRTRRKARETTSRTRGKARETILVLANTPRNHPCTRQKAAKNKRPRNYHPQIDLVRGADVR